MTEEVFSLLVITVLCLSVYVRVFVSFMRESQKFDDARDIWGNGMWHYKGFR